MSPADFKRYSLEMSRAGSFGRAIGLFRGLPKGVDWS